MEVGNNFNVFFTVRTKIKKACAEINCRRTCRIVHADIRAALTKIDLEVFYKNVLFLKSQTSNLTMLFLFPRYKAYLDSSMSPHSLLQFLPLCMWKSETALITFSSDDWDRDNISLSKCPAVRQISLNILLLAKTRAPIIYSLFQANHTFLPRSSMTSTYMFSYAIPTNVWN
jgi:hypothetical protein